jgi:hypothetical protein
MNRQFYRRKYVGALVAAIHSFMSSSSGMHSGGIWPFFRAQLHGPGELPLVSWRPGGNCMRKLTAKDSNI